MRTLLRRAGLLGAVVTLAATGVTLAATPASAAIKPCKTNPLAECTTVVSLAPGQMLHWRVSAGGAADPTVPTLRNGSRVGLICWLRGPSVNGDYFWFQAFNRDTAEFLPDYYLATGTYDHWRPLIEHCRL